LQQLEDLLDGWPGTMVVISHDRYLIERICDSTWALFGDGKLTNLPGGIEQYLSRRAELERDAAAREQSGRGGGAAAPGAGKQPGGAAEAAPRRSGAQDRALQKELSRLERAVARHDEEEARLHAALADAATDAERLQSLGTELSAVVAEKERAEERWMEIAAELE